MSQVKCNQKRGDVCQTRASVFGPLKGKCVAEDNNICCPLEKKRKKAPKK